MKRWIFIFLSLTLLLTCRVKADSTDGRYSDTELGGRNYFASLYGWNERVMEENSWRVNIYGSGVTIERNNSYEIDYFQDQMELMGRFITNETLFQGEGTGRGTAERILRIAYNELGEAEDLSVGRNYVKFNFWYYGDPDGVMYEKPGGWGAWADWCACFVAWCANEAGLLVDQGQGGAFVKSAYVPTASTGLQENGAIKFEAEEAAIFGGDKPLKPGDVFIVGWDEHIGLVLEVYSDHFVSIEGNYDNQVYSRPMYFEDMKQYWRDDDGNISSVETGYFLSVPYPSMIGDERMQGEACEIAMYEWLSDEGFSAAAIAGIFANVYCESGFDSGVEEYETGEGWGIIQWSFGRRTALYEFCDANGYSYDSLEGQLEYFMLELHESYTDTLNVLETVPDTEEGAMEAAEYFCRYFEAPANIESAVIGRRSLARMFYDKYS